MVTQTKPCYKQTTLQLQTTAHDLFIKRKQLNNNNKEWASVGLFTTTKTCANNNQRKLIIPVESHTPLVVVIISTQVVAVR